jgi:GH25 family lysozyme M1 (1,4-beta-N-acetylmuramidase)
VTHWRAPTTLLVAAAAAALALALAGPSAAAKPPRGIDVSRFQGKIKWRPVAKRIDFAYVQASRGSGGDCAVAPDRCGLDEQYLRNTAKARAKGVRVGPYHRMFADGGTLAQATADAVAEADLFVSMVQQAGGVQTGDLRPALDVETPFGGLNATELRAWIGTWTERVQAALGVKPVIYTNNSSWQATGNTTDFAAAGHPLWVAHWGVAAPLVPASSWAGNGWSLWQYSSSGRVKGIAGRVDLNRLGPGGYQPISVTEPMPG